MLSCRACRAAGGRDDLVLDLGLVPPADLFPDPHDPLPDPGHALAMWCCPRCGLAQLAEDDTEVAEPRAVEPQALRDQAAEAVRTLCASGLLDEVDHRAVEFGSPHGGSWLPQLGWPEAAAGETAGLVLDTFGLMHESDQSAAIGRRVESVAPGGVVVLQFHTLEAIVAQGQWNALRHGHYAYYTLNSLRALLESAGWTPIRAWEFALYGGTVLVAALRIGEAEPEPSVTAILERERAAGLTTAGGLASLSVAATAEAERLAAGLRLCSASGERVFGYGAASRAVALLDRAGIGGDLLRGVADASPWKQGRTLPTTSAGRQRVPIISPQELIEAKPDRVLLLLPDLGPEVAANYPPLADRLTTDLLSQAAIPVPARRSFVRSTALQRRLHELIPSGAHTYARGPDQYPEHMAPVLTHGDGARVYDVDGNCFVEYGMGLRSVTLGHGFAPVVRAVAEAAARGTNFSRPTALEVAAAEDFLTLVPGADMVKFAKNGSDATTAAVKLARAATGRDLIAIGDHPFFSVDDWFIGLTEMNAGVPRAIRELTERFHYNDLGSLERLFDRHDGQVAAVLLEAATATAEPAPGFLEGVRALCDRHGAVLIFDEMITGFRWSAGGAQSVYGVRPDLSCWGKAMGNGFPISALAGRRELMELGGLRTDRDRTFLLSTTHGPETTGLAAFRAVVQTYRAEDPIAAMEAAGRVLADGVAERVAAHGLEAYVGTAGRPSCLIYWTRDSAGVPSQAYRTLFLAGLLDAGVLGQSFITSAAHTQADLDITLDAVSAALVHYRRAIEAGSVAGILRGRPVAPALRRRADPRRESG